VLKESSRKKQHCFASVIPLFLVLLFIYFFPSSFLRAFAKLPTAAISIVMFCPSVRPSVRPSEWNKLASRGRIFVEFDITGFLKNLLGKFKFD